MNIVKEDLIDFQTVHLDTVGHMYEYQGRMLRVIYKSSRKHVERLMKCGLIDRLIKERLLVETWISDDRYEEDGMVLEHKRIIPQSDLSQWSFDMIRDAAILVLKMNRICLEYGYEMKDCHQYNVLFDGIRPVYVDFGSIIRRDKGCGESGWIARNDFMKSYYYPLHLWSRGYEELVGALMKSTDNMNVDEMKRLYYHLPPKVTDLLRSVSEFIPQRSADDEMKRLLVKMESLQYQSNTRWGTYQDCYWKDNTARFDYEIDWINQTSEIETMVEVGANQGYFAYLAATKTGIKKIIATDYDRKAVNMMYQRLKKRKTPDCMITPLVLDFVWASFERLKEYRSDLVVANALTHHLLLTQGVKMSVIADRLAELTDKYVIVEFMEYGVSQNKRSLPKWYTLDYFLAGLEKRFSIISVHKTERKRTAVIGKKK